MIPKLGIDLTREGGELVERELLVRVEWSYLYAEPE